jgi:hypothetical protein
MMRVNLLLGRTAPDRLVRGWMRQSEKLVDSSELQARLFRVKVALSNADSEALRRKAEEASGPDFFQKARTDRKIVHCLAQNYGVLFGRPSSRLPENQALVPVSRSRAVAPATCPQPLVVRTGWKIVRGTWMTLAISSYLAGLGGLLMGGSHGDASQSASFDTGLSPLLAQMLGRRYGPRLAAGTCQLLERLKA